MRRATMLAAAATFLAILATPVWAAPIFLAQAGPTLGNGMGGCNANNPGGASAAPITSDIVCADSLGNASAFAFADIGHIGGKSTVTTISASSLPGDFTTTSSYSDSVIFSSAVPGNATFTTAMLLSLLGHLDTANSANAFVRMRVEFDGTAASIISLESSSGVGTCVGPPPVCGSSGLSPILFSTSLFTVQTNTPVTMLMRLQTDAGAQRVGGFALADFGSSLEIPQGVDVFALPEGITANGFGGLLVNNRFVVPGGPPNGVPEPNTLALALIGIGFVVATFRRRRTAFA